MAVTVYDVAKAAGVSIATVSYVLNGIPRVGEATRERVLAAMDMLGYKPSPTARALAGQRIGLMGLMVSSVTYPYYAALVEAMEDKVRELDFIFNIFTTRGLADTQRRAISAMPRIPSDGFIVRLHNLSEGDIKHLMLSSAPIVNIGDPIPGIPAVIVDNERIGHIGASHLLELGHRRIAFIRTEDDFYDSDQRYGGYARALREHGIPVVPELVGNGHSSKIGGAQCAAEFLGLSPDLRPTAIFCGNDPIALGVYDFCSGAGLRIPEDLSVVGVDDIAEAKHARPPLTTVRQPYKDIAENAIGLLMRMIDGEKVSGDLTVWLDPELALRGSAAPIRIQQ